MRFLNIGVFACVAAAAACSSSSSPAPEPDSGIVEDAGVVVDTGVAVDTGVVVDTGAPDTAVAEAAAPEAGPSSTFTMVYTDIISPICVTCHNPQGIGVTSGMLDMSSKATAFSDLVGVAAMGSGCSGKGTRVVAGNAATSILFEKVDPNQGAPCGSKMPLGGTPLTDAQASEIESWINGGAMNN
jgi:hypothetical protein